MSAARRPLRLFVLDVLADLAERLSVRLARAQWRARDRWLGRAPGYVVTKPWTVEGTAAEAEKALAEVLKANAPPGRFAKMRCSMRRGSARTEGVGIVRSLPEGSSIPRDETEPSR